MDEEGEDGAFDGSAVKAIVTKVRHRRTPAARAADGRETPGAAMPAAVSLAPCPLHGACSRPRTRARRAPAAPVGRGAHGAAAPPPRALSVSAATFAPLTALPPPAAHMQVCNNCLLNQPFAHQKVGQWVSTIVENVLKELAVANDDAAKNGHAKFKYVVSVILQQRAGAALQIAAAQYWEKATDGMTTVKWESDAIQLVATVHGVMV